MYDSKGTRRPDLAMERYLIIHNQIAAYCSIANTSSLTTTSSTNLRLGTHRPTAATPALALAAVCFALMHLPDLPLHVAVVAAAIQLVALARVLLVECRHFEPSTGWPHPSAEAPARLVQYDQQTALVILALAVRSVPNVQSVSLLVL